MPTRLSSITNLLVWFLFQQVKSLTSSSYDSTEYYTKAINVVKYPITVTIEGEILDEIEKLRKTTYVGASRSYVVETLLRIALKKETDISVAR